MAEATELEQVRELAARVEALEARVAQLEGAPRSTRRAATAGRGDGAELDASSWTRPYETTGLEVAETWIELHEPSARPQLQRLVRQLVDGEGPITERLALDRIRRAWGLKRAGGRVQEAFDQAVRQLVARALVERDGDALRAPGSRLEAVRVPTEDEATRRAAEEVPLEELALAITRATGSLGGSGDVDDVTMRVAKLLGWTRRGGAIQERLDAAVRRAADEGSVEVAGSRINAV